MLVVLQLLEQLVPVAQAALVELVVLAVQASTELELAVQMRVTAALAALVVLAAPQLLGLLALGAKAVKAASVVLVVPEE